MQIKFLAFFILFTVSSTRTSRIINDMCRIKPAPKLKKDGTSSFNDFINQKLSNLRQNAIQHLHLYDEFSVNFDENSEGRMSRILGNHENDIRYMQFIMNDIDKGMFIFYDSDEPKKELPFISYEESELIARNELFRIIIKKVVKEIHEAKDLVEKLNIENVPFFDMLVHQIAGIKEYEEILDKSEKKGIY